MAVKAGGFAFAWAGRVPPNWPNMENENVIVVNHPCSLESLYVPAYATYYHQPFPRTLRVLVPACTSFDVQRTDDKTLVIESRGSNIFSCDDVDPIHAANALSTVDRLLQADFKCKKGDCSNLGNLTVEVLESDVIGLPSRVAFHFNQSLDSRDFRWLCFDWTKFSSKPFTVPAIGQSITLSGPKK